MARTEAAGRLRRGRAGGRTGGVALRWIAVPLLALAAGGCSSTGVHTAELRPLNPKATGQRGATGTARFTIDAALFTAAVDATGLSPGPHPMQIRIFGRCPPPEADTNGDGYIDIVEALRFFGPALIPLDGDIESQLAGAAVQPLALPDGTLHYRRSGSSQALMLDLERPDSTAPPRTTRLPPNGRLDLSTRSVVIQGVAPGTRLPASVETLPGVPAYMSLPVACGLID